MVQSSWGSQGHLGILVFAGEHNIHIFSLMCSLTILGEFRCALSKDYPFLYNSELWGGGGGGEGGSIFSCAILGVSWEIAVLALLMCNAISWCVL